MATWGSIGSKLYFRQPNDAVVYVWDSTGAPGNRSQAFGQQFAWIRPRADAGDDYLAFTVRDSNGIPGVWLYAHGAPAAGQRPNYPRPPPIPNPLSPFLLPIAPPAPPCTPTPPTRPPRH